MDSGKFSSQTGWKGRGAGGNPVNRFKPVSLERDRDCPEIAPPPPDTEWIRDASRAILATNDSPDVGFDTSLNPYRGCEHGCVYCYARPTHEYFEWSAGLDFETKILVKETAPELLERTLASPRWQPRAVALSGVTDSYQPAERELEITRRCLEVFVKFRNPVALVTKNHLVTRDRDLLSELGRCDGAAVYLSLTTLDPALSRVMEPRASLPEKRLEAMRVLREAGVPVGVLVAPVIPALTDHEIPALLHAAAEAGAQFAGYMVLRLPHGVKDLFADWLDRHFPTHKDKVLNRVRALRGGRLNDPRFGSRMKGEGVFADQIDRLFSLARKKAGIPGDGPRLTTRHFRQPDDCQLKLFD